MPDGARVLDAGCGPGRFALDLARRGARLTLVDLSPVQLEQARQHISEAGLLERVQAFHCLDIVNLEVLPDASFEVVVCYGAVLSYTVDRYPTALQELARVLLPGGRLLISVNSLYGTLRLLGAYDAQSFLEPPEAHLDWQAVLSGAAVIFTRPGSPEFHQPLVLFTSAGLRQALERAGLQELEMAAANPLVSEAAPIPRITDSAQASAELTRLELALCSPSRAGRYGRAPAGGGREGKITCFG